MKSEMTALDLFYLVLGQHCDAEEQSLKLFIDVYSLTLV